MTYRRLIPLAVLLVAVAACDFKETRSGVITLTTGAPIPLNGRNGAAQLVAGTAEFTFRQGSKENTVSVTVRQNGRPEVQIEAPVPGDFQTGNFTLKGSEIGQPVDITSTRNYMVTGPRTYYTDWEDRGFEHCRVDVSYDPCDEAWGIAFSGASGDLGRFAARTPMRCNERRGMPYACWREPTHDYPRHDYPRGPGRHGHRNILMEKATELGAENINFD